MLTVMEERGMTGTTESYFLKQSFFRAFSSLPFDPLQVPSSLTSNAASESTGHILRDRRRTVFLCTTFGPHILEKELSRYLLDLAAPDCRALRSKKSDAENEEQT